MALQIGTVDGLVNITPKAIYCFVNAIDAFSMGGIEYARKANVSLGTAFQRFVEPVYSGAKQNFDLQDIYKPAYTTNNKEQSPARVTFCKKMGLLKIDDVNDVFELTPLGREVMLKNITIEEYTFILLSKQGVFVDGMYVCNLFSLIAQRFENSATISDLELLNYIKDRFNDSNIEKTRTDIIINALCTTGLIIKISKGIYVLSNTKYAEIFRDFKDNSQFLSPSYLDGDDAYTDYMGDMNYGVFDIINNNNKDIYISQYPNIVKYANLNNKIMNTEKMPKNPIDGPHQQIFYGAPGTGKSFEINRLTKDKEVIRTTFHPDSDYSTFVGAYKPTSIEVPVRDVTGKVIIENGKQVTENRIVYEFVEQAFLQAYIKSWKAYADIDEGETPEEQYLVIEEINRGNCAQIFGDLFQLLDRNCYGFSDYPITADKDMKKQLAKAFKGITISNAEHINDIYGKDIVAQVLNGDILLLPDNLYIWATMNTSDQSLFPIDSAFKRRWDWKYIPISEGKEKGVSLGWKIKVAGKQYDWWQFVKKINDEIGEQTKSEDKKLGYFFCKAQDGIISAETFVSKVVFYLWNDVFKDQAFASDIFRDGEDELTFNKFYDVKDSGETTIKEDKVELFLTNLDLGPLSLSEEPLEEIEEDSLRSVAHRQLLSVSFSDGTKFDVADGLTHFAVYREAIKKIGVERAETIAAASKYHRLGHPVICKEKFPEIESSDRYSYEQVGDYFLVKGMSEDTYINILNLCNVQLNLGLDIKFRQ